MLKNGVWLALAASMLMVTDADAGDDTYAYDDLGRLRTVWLADGTRIDYVFDAAGNRKTLTTTVGGPGPPDTTPPTAPAGLSASVASATTINLSWTASTDSGSSGLASYRVERCTGSGCGSFAEIGFTATAGYSDTTVAGVTTYQYRVRARDGAGNDSGYSNTAAGTTPDGTPPTTPTSLILASTPTSTVVSIRWTRSTDNVAISGYRVERCAGAGCSNFADIGGLVGDFINPIYNDMTTSGTTNYLYRVRAYDPTPNYSAYSSSLAVTTPDTIIPTVPMDLNTNSPNSNTVNLSWTASTDLGGSGLAGYHIIRNEVQIGIAPSTSYSDTTVAGSTEYTYKIRAYDNAGNNSPQSAPRTVTTGDTLPPNAPASASASAVSPSRIDVTHGGSVDNGGSGIAGYRLYRNGGLVMTSMWGPWFEAGLSPSTTYSYTVRAYDNVGNESADSPVASATTLAPGIPTAPTISPQFLMITGPGPTPTVSWTTPSGTEYFNLYRSVWGNPYTLFYSGPNTSIIHNGPAAEYAYKVNACNVAGCSVDSNISEIIVCPGGGCQ